MPTPARLRTEQTGSLYWIIAENPTRLNAFTADMWDALPDLVRDAETRADIRVVVLTGAGDKAFSTGADISGLGRASPDEDMARRADFDNSAFGVLAACRKPTIAMINGICFGGGCELALCCDFRLASDTAHFSIPAARLGVAYDPRWIRPLLRVVAPAKVKEMLMTARRYDAKAALAMGLVTAVVAQADLRQETETLAAELAANAPLSMLAAKRAVDALAHAPDTVDFAPLDALVRDCLISDDYKEGRQAFLAKRKPQFKGA
jgi:enoyl-CoA hydratase/carnithine racemase